MNHISQSLQDEHRLLQLNLQKTDLFELLLHLQPNLIANVALEAIFLRHYCIGSVVGGICSRRMDVDIVFLQDRCTLRNTVREKWLQNQIEGQSVGDHQQLLIGYHRIHHASHDLSIQLAATCLQNPYQLLQIGRHVNGHGQIPVVSILRQRLLRNIDLSLFGGRSDQLAAKIEYSLKYLVLLACWLLRTLNQLVRLGDN